MSLSAELRKQARELASLDRQANLRRAVSAAYYSVFHLLLDAFDRQVLSSVRSRRTVSRSYGTRWCSTGWRSSGKGILQESGRETAGVLDVAAIETGSLERCDATEGGTLPTCVPLRVRGQRRRGCGVVSLRSAQTLYVYTRASGCNQFH